MSETTSGIAELIARIKQDGIEAGEQERVARIAEAEREAERIIANAKADAERIRGEARANAAARQRQLEAELRMAARDFVFRFQERLRAQVIEPLASAASRDALSDSAVVSELILEILRGWSAGARVSVAPELRTKLVSALGERVHKAVADGGIEICDEEGLRGFRLVRSGEQYVWDVSDEAVARELARLVEPEFRVALSPERPQPQTLERPEPVSADASAEA